MNCVSEVGKSLKDFLSEFSAAFLCTVAKSIYQRDLDLWRQECNVFHQACASEDHVHEKLDVDGATLTFSS